MRIALLLMVVVSAGCTHDHSDLYPFDARGLHPEVSGYRIDYANAERYSLVSPDWRIDNYELDESTEEPEVPTRAPGADVVLHHRRNAGVMWTDSLELGAAYEQTSLRVLADTYVASIAENGYIEGRLESATTVRVRERRYAAELLDRQDISVGGNSGTAVLIDVANLNQAELTPDERQARALVVFVRIPRTRLVQEGNLRSSEPLILVAGYANAPAAFDEGMADFRALLASIQFEPAR